MTSIRWLLALMVGAMRSPIFFSIALVALAACGGSTESTSGGGAGGSSTSTASTGTTFTLDEGQCRDTMDCKESGSYCATPGAPSCGGAGCMLQTCSLDGDCANFDDPFVCEIEPCCGDKRCVHGCNMETDCPEGQACTPDFHCVPKPCDMEACPANFDCGMGAVPSCARRSCASDAECEGYCVLGDCYSSPGICDFPKP